jgi:hypothetical protein
MLKNHFLFLVMYREHLESMSHVSFKPPSITYIGREGVDGLVDHPSVLSQSGGRTLQRENQAYVGNDHHDEDVGHTQSVYAQSGSLMDQNHMSDG